MTWKKFNTALDNWIFRFLLLGFGGIAFGLGGLMLVQAWSGQALAFLVDGASSLIPLTAGAFMLILGIFGRIVQSSKADSDGESIPGQSAAKGLLRNLPPEGKAEGLVHMLGYAWLLFCAVVLFKCFLGLISVNAPVMPLWFWCVPLLAWPVVWWMRSRWQARWRWGRCELHLDAPAELGKPFAGVVEAETRFVPTKDFHFTLFYEVSNDPMDSGWWERSKSKQVVSQDRMDESEPQSRVPFAFEALSPGSDRPDKSKHHRWRLNFRTQIDGHSYEEDFTGEIRGKFYL